MSCPSGKRSFSNRAKALAALLKYRFKKNGKLRRSSSRKERGAYRCELCGGKWHTTSKPGAELDLGIDDAA